MRYSEQMRYRPAPGRPAITGLLVAVLAALPTGVAWAQPVINELVLNHVGTDTNEYVEVWGAPGTDYSAYTALQLEGDFSGTLTGTIDSATTLGTTDGAGLWVSAFGNNLYENGTLTLLLVEGFTGAVGQDLDTNDDGVLDVLPWTAVVDSVAVTDGGANDLEYSAVVLAPGFDGIVGTPGGASRIPDGTDTDTVADWLRNDFDGAGLPGFTGTPEVGEAFNTPGLPNEAVPPPDPLINELVLNHVGIDIDEYVEVYGAADSDYSAFTVVQLEGDFSGTLTGTIDSAQAVGTTDAAGLWVSAFGNNVYENGTVTLLLVEGFTGAVGQDLDTNDDGVLDVMPWTRIVDDVAVTDGGGTDLAYSAVVLTPGYDGIAGTPGGASRIPNGTDTDTVGDWVRNDFDGEGLPGFIGTPVPGEAYNTPLLPNEAVPELVGEPTINEVVRDHVGADTNEYLEVYGDPSTDYSTFTLLEIEGDGAPLAGTVDGVYTVGTTDGAGIWCTGFLDNELENGTLTLLLVEGFTGAAGQDLDTDDDGVLDVTPWTRVVDDVALADGGVGDLAYSATVLTPGYDGNAQTPGGASRIPDGADSDAAADWVRNDYDGEGLPGFIGTPEPGEALNTPCLPNDIVEVPKADPVLNEIVRDHVGVDTDEYVEVYGDPSTSYSEYSILEIEGDVTSPTGTIDGVYAVGTTDAAGLWWTGFLNSEFENGTLTVLLVEGFTGAAGQDLDTDDDGVFDVAPWVRVVDDLTLTDGTAGDLFYSTAVLTPGYDGFSATPGGASRLPDGADSDSAADWVRNDFDGAGLPGFVGTPDEGEAFNTPGLTNVPVPPVDPIPATICQIQGPGLLSPFAGQKVATVDNVVTVVTGVGFYIQTPVACDGDPSSSDGVFVFTSTPPAVAVGDQVDVTGWVEEYFDNTEIGRLPTVTVDSSGNPLPPPVIFDENTPSPFRPQPDNEVERYEGMLVRFENGVVTGPTDNFGDAQVVVGHPLAFRDRGIEWPGLTSWLPVWDGNPEIFELNPDCAGLPHLDLDRGQPVLVAEGALDYTFGDYAVCATTLAVGPPPPLPRPVRDRLAGEYAIATLNMERFFDEVDDPLTSDTVETPETVEARLDRFSAYIRTVLKAPDILAVQEVENLPLLERLAARIQENDPALIYTAYLEEGNDIGGIDAGFLVRDTVAVVSVTQQFKDLTWDYMGNITLLFDRPPLELMARLGGAFDVEVINNHLRSLGGIDDPVDGDRVRHKRFLGAYYVSTLVRDAQDNFPDTRLVVTGDFNAYQFTDGYADVIGQISGKADLWSLIPVDDIVDPNLFDAVNLLPPEERYSFVFRGSAQALDHMLVGNKLAPFVSGVQYARANADASAGYHDTPPPGLEVLRVTDHDSLTLFVDSTAVAPPLLRRSR